MIKTFVLTLAGGGMLVLSTGLPLTPFGPAGWFAGHEPGSMLLLATVLFVAASAVRRGGKRRRRS